MRCFLIRSFLFLLPLLVGAIVMEVLLRWIPNDYSVKDQGLRSRSADLEVLVLGSSHAYYGIMPEAFSRPTFNAANVSQSLDLDSFLCRKYLPVLPRLKCVVVSVSSFSSTSEIKRGPEAWRIQYYERHFGLGKSRSLWSTLELRTRPPFASSELIADYYISGNENVFCQSDGFGVVRQEMWKNLEESGRESGRRHSEDLAELFEHRCNDLQEIIDMCEQRDVSVVLCTLPGFSSYRRYLNRNLLNQMISFCTEVASEHRGVVYRNLLDSVEFNDADFFDGDHLSPAGAAKCSRQLDSVISSLIVASDLEEAKTEASP